VRELSFASIGPRTRALVLVALAGIPPVSCHSDLRPHTPLTRAAATGDVARLRAVLGSGSAPDVGGLHGWPPLTWAVRGGHLEAIRTLVREGADPDLPDSGHNGWTPLLHAIHKGQLSAAGALLDAGADVNATGRDGLTPLMMAAGYGYNEWVLLLLGRGASPAAQTSRGSTALSFAVLGVSDIDRFTLGTCQTETVGTLLDHSPGLRLMDNREGRWALRAAKFFGCTAVVERLTRADEVRAGAPRRLHSRS